MPDPTNSPGLPDGYANSDDGYDAQRESNRDEPADSYADSLRGISERDWIRLHTNRYVQSYPGYADGDADILANLYPRHPGADTDSDCGPDANRGG